MKTPVIAAALAAAALISLIVGLSERGREMERARIEAYQACVASTERIAKLAIESRIDRLISLPSCTMR